MSFEREVVCRSAAPLAVVKERAYEKDYGYKSTNATSLAWNGH